MDPKSKEFKRLIHQRMLRFYALSCIIRKKNFAKFIKDYVLPNINIDRPYLNNPKGWEVDCYIKSNIDAVFKAFLKTVELIGKERFTAQVKEEITLINDIGSLAHQQGLFGKPN